MKKTNSICLLGLSLIAGYSCDQKTKTTENETDKNNPNVIIMLADDLGYNDLSCYRNAHPALSDMPPTCQTPHLDRLAEEGMRFTDFYCGAAVCSPSRAVLLTGRNATRVGIYNWIPGKSPMHLRNEEITIAEILKEQGYQTGHFGKWHLTSEGMDQPIPNDQGFDYSFFAYNNARPSHKNPVNYHRNGKPVGELQGYACQLVVDEAINWLEKAKNNDRPFYLNVWFNEPHEKVAAPDSLRDNHQYKKTYYGCIENMDNASGRLLHYLQKNDLVENTVVMFSSDNGSQELHSNDPLRGEKCFNYDGGIRIPFIIRWPGNIPSGKISNVPAGFADILPTIAEYTGAKIPGDRSLDGKSLATILNGTSSTTDREKPIFFYRYFHEPICMLRRGDWCLLGYEDTIAYAEDLNQKELAKFKPGPEEQPWAQWGFQENHMEAIPNQDPAYFELYNLRKDPGQKNDLSGNYPEKVNKMKQEMIQLRNEMITEGGDWFKN